MRLVLSGGELFDLYCTEIGKPHSQICWYQMNGWVDIAVLEWVREIRGIPLPNAFETIPELRGSYETTYSLPYCNELVG